MRECGRDLREGGQVWEVERVGERKEEKGREGSMEGEGEGEKCIRLCSF